MPADEERSTAGEGDEQARPRPLREQEVAAALDRLAEPGRLRDAERRIAGLAPQLQRILAAALADGGWFDEAHRSEVLRAATKPDPDERIAAVRTLVAEETRVAMLIGATAGWELAVELGQVAGSSAGGGCEPGPGSGSD